MRRYVVIRTMALATITYFNAEVEYPVGSEALTIRSGHDGSLLMRFDGDWWFSASVYNDRAQLQYTLVNPAALPAQVPHHPHPDSFPQGVSS